MNNNIFCNNKEKYFDALNKSYLINELISVTEIENGIVLPFKCKYNGWGVEAEGGICNSKNEFIDGHFTHYNTHKYINWRNCTKSYSIDKKIVKRNETVIYAGVMIDAFGHFIIESLSRLWYWIENQNMEYKLIFLNFDNNGKIYFENILNFMGLKKEQYEVITEITQFDKIIVPEQSLFIGSNYYNKCRKTFDYIISKAQTSNFKKIYLSKSKFGYNSSKREIYFENFYKQRGFEIIYPEKLPFEDQVSIINSADEIVCTMGTLVHLTFFSKNNVKLTILSRTENIPFNLPCLLSIQLREIEAYFVDVTYNFLPVNFNGSNFFIGPTKHWIEYLNKCGIPYEPEEVSFDIHVKPHVFDYLLEWAKHHSNQNNYNRIKNNTLADVINTISRTFLDYEIDTKSLPERDDVVKMQNYIKKDVSELTGVPLEQNLTQEVNKIIQSSNIQQNLQNLATQTQNNFKGAQNAVNDLQKKNVILNQKVTSLEERIAELEKKLFED